MVVKAYYIESIIPRWMENVTDGIEYNKGNIPFRAEVVEQSYKSIERILGLKESEYSAMIKPEVKLPFKRHDRVILFEKTLTVVDIYDRIPEKHSLRASRSKLLYERYVERVVILK